MYSFFLFSFLFLYLDTILPHTFNLLTLFSNVCAPSVLGIIQPFAILLTAIMIDNPAFAVSAVSFEFANLPGSVFPLELTLPFAFVVVHLAFLPSAISPKYLPLSIHVIVSLLSFLNGATLPLIPAISVLFAIFVVTVLLVTITEHLLSPSLLHVFEPCAFLVVLALCPDKAPMALFTVVTELTFLVRSISPHKLSFSMSIVFLPLTVLE